MAFVTVPEFCIPAPMIVAGPALSTTALLDAASETLAMMVSAPKTGNIRKVLFRFGAVTTPAVMEIRIETLDRTATPAVNSTTLWGTDTSATLDNTGLANTAQVVQLTADAAVTKGDTLAVVIKQPAASSGNCVVSTLSPPAVGAGSFPYALHLGSALFRGMILGLEYDDGTYAPLGDFVVPTSTITTNNVGTGSTPDAIGDRFQLAAPVRACGFWVATDSDGPFTARIVSTAYHQGNATGILATSGTIENEDRLSNASGMVKRPFQASVELAKDTNYRFIIEATSATTLAIYDYTMPSLASMGGIPGGSAWHLTTAKDPTQDSDWTNYNSGTFRRLVGGLVFDGIDDGTAVGGASGGFIIGG